MTLFFNDGTLHKFPNILVIKQYQVHHHQNKFERCSNKAQPTKWIDYIQTDPQIVLFFERKPNFFDSKTVKWLLFDESHNFPLH